MRELWIPLLLSASCGGDGLTPGAIGGVHAAAPKTAPPFLEVPGELACPSPRPHARFGHATTALDFDGDGSQDVAVGAPGEPAVYVFYGPSLTWSRRFAPAEGRAGDFGHDLAAGDLDGKGGDELVVGAPKTARGAEAAAGAVYILAHDREVPTPLGIKAAAGALLGTSVALADFDGDGAADVACGAPKHRLDDQPSGAVFFLCPTERTEWVVTNPIGPWKHGNFGHDLAVADADGDGDADLFVSALGNPSSSGVAGAGQVFVLPNPVPGSEPIAIEDPTATSGDGARFGMSIFARDVNADGNADLLVGAPRKNGGGVEDAGQGFLFLGPAFSSDDHRVFLRPQAKPHDVLGFRALAADVMGDEAVEVMFCSLARHQDMAIVAWSGGDPAAPARVWSPPTNAGHHFVQGFDHTRPELGTETLLIGDPSYSAGGRPESGRVLLRRLESGS